MVGPGIENQVVENEEDVSPILADLPLADVAIEAPGGVWGALSSVTDHKAMPKQGYGTFAESPTGVPLVVAPMHENRERSV